jgi:hypothetical protein
MAASPPSAPQSQPRVLGMHGGIDCARPLRIGVFRDKLGKADVDARNVEDAGRAERTGPVDDLNARAAVCRRSGSHPARWRQ